MKMQYDESISFSTNLHGVKSEKQSRRIEGHDQKGEFWMKMEQTIVFAQLLQDYVAGMW